MILSREFLFADDAGETKSWNSRRFWVHSKQREKQKKGNKSSKKQEDKKITFKTVMKENYSKRKQKIGLVTFIHTFRPEPKPSNSLQQRKKKLKKKGELENKKV